MTKSRHSLIGLLEFNDLPYDAILEICRTLDPHTLLIVSLINRKMRSIAQEALCEKTWGADGPHNIKLQQQFLLKFIQNPEKSIHDFRPWMHTTWLQLTKDFACHPNTSYESAMLAYTAIAQYSLLQGLEEEFDAALQRLEFLGRQEPILLKVMLSKIAKQLKENQLYEACLGPAALNINIIAATSTNLSFFAYLTKDEATPYILDLIDNLNQNPIDQPYKIPVEAIKHLHTHFSYHQQIQVRDRLLDLVNHEETQLDSIQALLTLAPFLAPSDRAPIISALLDLFKTEEANTAVRRLSKVIPYLTAAEITKITITLLSLLTKLEITYSPAIIQAIVHLAPYIEPTLRSEICPHLYPNELALVSLAWDSSQQTAALSSLEFDFAPDSIHPLKRALQNLITLIPYFSMDEFKRLVPSLKTLASLPPPTIELFIENITIKAIAALCPYLSESERHELLNACLPTLATRSAVAQSIASILITLKNPLEFAEKKILTILLNHLKKPSINTEEINVIKALNTLASHFTPIEREEVLIVLTASLSKAIPAAQQAMAKTIISLLRDEPRLINQLATDELVKQLREKSKEYIDDAKFLLALKSKTSPQAPAKSSKSLRLFQETALTRTPLTADEYHPLQPEEENTQKNPQKK